MKVGFIGLGIMGKPMSRNLLKAGYSLVVYDVDQKAVEELVSCKAEAAKNGKEVAERCDVVITMVPDSPQVRAAVLGRDGAAEGMHKGSVLIDMSSIDPMESRAVVRSWQR